MLDFLRGLLDVLDHRRHGVGVVLHLGQVDQLGAADQVIGEAADAVDDLFQRSALATQGLRALGIVPDVGAFQLPVYFLETFDLEVEVKDTP
ncbi:hypothetical protein GCM10027266_22430 [Arenimonas alkanexedens]